MTHSLTSDPSCVTSDPSCVTSDSTFPSFSYVPVVEALVNSSNAMKYMESVMSAVAAVILLTTVVSFIPLYSIP